METPKTLTEAIKFFQDENNAIQYLASRRWPDGVKCIHCGTDRPMFLETRKIWKCRACRKQFSVKVGTIFAESPISLGNWLTAVWMVTNCKNGVSSYEIGRDLGITQKSAWHMLHRVRKAMQDEETGGKLSGEVEIDETFIGGKARNMHHEKKLGLGKNYGKKGTVGKIAVLGMLERDGRVRTKVVRNTRRRFLKPNVLEHVEKESTVYTDALASYNDLHNNYIHHVIDHAEKYVDGQVHTNGMENYWSLLKRTLRGTYVSVEPFHLFRYLDEQALRFNLRKLDDAERFAHVCSHVAGRRVTWDELTGKSELIAKNATDVAKLKEDERL
jgi:transposase-like protein